MFIFPFKVSKKINLSPKCTYLYIIFIITQYLFTSFFFEDIVDYFLFLDVYIILPLSMFFKDGINDDEFDVY